MDFKPIKSEILQSALTTEIQGAMRVVEAACSIAERYNEAVARIAELEKEITEMTAPPATVGE